MSCACVLMSVLRDCCSLASDEDAGHVFNDIVHFPCITMFISAVAQFNKVVADGRSTGSQAIRAKADLLLNASSGLILNLSNRASNLGANDCLLGSGLVRALSESATFTTSSYSISSNCMSIIGRLFHSQIMRDDLCSSAQHGARLVKFLLSVFHEHHDPAPRLLAVNSVCSLLESAACCSTFFKAGGSTVVFDAVKSLAFMHKSFQQASEAATVDSIFVFAAAAAMSSYAYNAAPWFADLHSSGHLRAQSLLMQTLSTRLSEATSAAASLMLFVIPHPSPSFTRPPSCSHVFGSGPLNCSDHIYWTSPVSGVHVRSMKEQMEVDRVMQAMRALMAYCETDDLTAESSRINIDKIIVSVRALVSSIVAGGGSDVSNPVTFKYLSNVCGTIAGLLRHVSYKLACVASKLFQQILRQTKQSEEFNGIEDEYALLGKRADVIEDAILQRVVKLRSQLKDTDFPEHKPMLVISSEEVTNVNPDDVLRQYGAGGSVALVHSGKDDGTSVKSVFLGFSGVEKQPIPLVPPMPHFGEVPASAAVEGSIAFYKRHNVIASKARNAIPSKSVDTELHDAGEHESKANLGEFDEVEAAARDAVTGMGLHNLDGSILFVLRHVVGMNAQVVRHVLNLVQSMLQLESEWDRDSFASASNTFRENAQLRNCIIKLLLHHSDDLSIVRPSLVILCFVIHNVKATPETQAMYVLRALTRARYNLNKIAVATNQERHPIFL
jgi:hypothetical protein